MSANLNKVTLIGRLGADPDIRSFSNGGKVANLRVATSESWTDRASGERKERTEWHQVVVASEGLVTVAERYLRKGKLVYVEGQLRTRKWQDQGGQDRYSTEIVLIGFDAKMIMLDSQPSGRGETGGYADEARERSREARDSLEGGARSGGGGSGATSGGAGGGFNAAESHAPLGGFDDDEIPF